MYTIIVYTTIIYSSYYDIYLLYTQYNTIIEDTGFIWFYRQVNGIISIRIPIDSNAYINTVTDQKESIITVGDGTSAMITITQVQ